MTVAKDAAELATGAVTQAGSQSRTLLVLMFIVLFAVESFQTYKITDFGERLIRVEERQTAQQDTLDRLERLLEKRVK